MVRHRSGTMGDITLIGPYQKSRGLRATQLQSDTGENNNPTHKNITLTQNTNKTGLHGQYMMIKSRFFLLKPYPYKES